MNDEPIDDELGEQLKALLGAGSDVGSRTAADVDRRLRATSVSGLCLELLGVGWWSLAAVLEDSGPSSTENLTDLPVDADGGGRGAHDG